MRPILKKKSIHKKPLLELKDVCGTTPSGRFLFEGLNMTLAKEKVALIGRNGVGKSSLLEMLSGKRIPDKGQVLQQGSLHYVPQLLTPSIGRTTQGCSRGEFRKLKLLAAKLSGCDVLILDEPTQDLDQQGIVWLLSWLQKWPDGLLVASHEIELLREFRNFFIVAETGCEYFEGTFDELTQKQERESVAQQNGYDKQLHRLLAKEKWTHKVARRRLRKKQYGRANEMGRATSKLTLNQKRDYAQVKHGLMKKKREAKLNFMRQQTLQARRSLKVQLPGIAEITTSKKPREPLITSTNISLKMNGRVLLENFNLTLQDQKIAVVGPNGSGKTTLIHTLIGLRDPFKGHVSINKSRVGSILQDGSNWLIDESVVEYLSRMNSDLNPEDLGLVLRKNKFPLALAERPLHSLSPGERVRAALICLLNQMPRIELLVLDEPTNSLDLPGLASLKELLKNWNGGLMVVSHSRLFLREIGVEQNIEL